MRAHRRHATPSLRRRLANAQSAQQVGGQDRLRWGEIECVGEDGRIRGRLGERIRDLDNDGRGGSSMLQQAGAARLANRWARSPNRRLRREDGGSRLH
jgi:hypothetical protein